MSQISAFKNIAILGAGVMGAQIAAQCVNAGFNTRLYDLASEGKDKNKIAKSAVARLKKLKPNPLASDELAELIICQNYDDDLASLKDCDLIIEAVTERLDIKKSLYQKISPFIASDAILVTNTSGISINELASLLPQSVGNNFCGVHFFNPPRYMHLLELIPSKDISANQLNRLETFFTHHLGKGVVRAKDTPNFIANRIGVFSLLVTMHHAERFGLSLDTVDALTGELIGRPKSATFRTMDVVGLDTMGHVIETMAQQCKDSPWHEYYKLPAWLNDLIATGALGQKSGRGVYQKKGKVIEVWDNREQKYVTAKATLSPEILSILKEKDLSKRFLALKNASCHEAQFLYHCYLDLFHYCAFYLEKIAHKVSDIDNAISWGFGWTQGPFSIWQAAGMNSTFSLQEEVDKGRTLVAAKLPSWLAKVDAFYQEGSFNPHTKSYETVSTLPIYQKQLTFKHAKRCVFEDDSVIAWTLDDKNLILSFKSSGNSIGLDVLSGINRALDVAEKEFDALILWQESDSNFSLGANLKQFVTLFAEDKKHELSEAIYQFQRTALRLTYSSIPTIAAVRGRALGGGLELIMHCDDSICALESYVGLVEMGVGLLPAGGGLKTLAINASKLSCPNAQYAYLEDAFKMVATAFVATSSLEAVKKGFLNQSTRTVMNTKELLYSAMGTANYLTDLGYRPKVNPQIQVMGLEANARLNLIITNMHQGGFISEHDAYIAKKIAFVLTGGNVNEGTIVDEEWFLRLEREAFVELALTDKTRDRVLHILETGKPLRN